MKIEIFRKISLSAAILPALVSIGCGLHIESGQAKENPQFGIENAAPEIRKNAPPAASAPQTAGTRFRGSIGESKFEMNLQRDGNRLSGSYFYLKSGSANALKLSGKLDADGKFALQEFDAAGKQTGEFFGAWKNDRNDLGATLEGEWHKPKVREGAFFYAEEQIVSETNAFQINAKKVNEINKPKRIEVSAEYPELVGTANAAGFNALVKKLATAPLAEFKKDILATTAEDLKFLPAEMNFYLEISHRLTYADDQFVSVYFVNSSFTGGAHPNYYYFTVNYDLKNNRELKLADLFKPNSKYLEEIAEYSLKDLQSRADESGENLGLATEMWAEGATPTAENYKNWNLTKKGLMFTFDPYQVGPYAAGSQTVIVPFDNLKDLARTDGALAKWMK